MIFIFVHVEIALYCILYIIILSKPKQIIKKSCRKFQVCSTITNENQTGYINRGNFYREREKESTFYLNVILGIWGDIQSKQPYRVHNLHDSSRFRCKRQPPWHSADLTSMALYKRTWRTRLFLSKEIWWLKIVIRYNIEERKSKTMVNLSKILFKWTKILDTNCF